MYYHQLLLGACILVAALQSAQGLGSAQGSPDTPAPPSSERPGSPSPDTVGPRSLVRQRSSSPNRRGSSSPASRDAQEEHDDRGSVQGRRRSRSPNRRGPPSLDTVGPPSLDTAAPRSPDTVGPRSLVRRGSSSPASRDAQEEHDDRGSVQGRARSRSLKRRGSHSSNREESRLPTTEQNGDQSRGWGLVRLPFAERRRRENPSPFASPPGLNALFVPQEGHAPDEAYMKAIETENLDELGNLKHQMELRLTDIKTNAYNAEIRNRAWPERRRLEIELEDTDEHLLPLAKMELLNMDTVPDDKQKQKHRELLIKRKLFELNKNEEHLERILNYAIPVELRHIKLKRKFFELDLKMNDRTLPDKEQAKLAIKQDKLNVELGKDQKFYSYSLWELGAPYEV